MTAKAFFRLVQNHCVVGGKSVGVPGTVSGMELAREKSGTMPRAALLAPSIALADKTSYGFVVRRQAAVDGLTAFTITRRVCLCGWR